MPGSSVQGIFQARTLSGLPFPPPGDLPDSGMKPVSPVSLALLGRLFTTVPPGKSHHIEVIQFIFSPVDLSCTNLIIRTAPPPQKKTQEGWGGRFLPYKHIINISLHQVSSF